MNNASKMVVGVMVVFTYILERGVYGKEPSAPAEEVHRSKTISHLGNISIMLNQDHEWDPNTARFVNNTMANAMLDRAMREPLDAIYLDLVTEL